MTLLTTPKYRNLLRPSYRTGFARNQDESQHPWFWRNLIGTWAPFLGPSGLKLFDWGGKQNWGDLTNMDPDTDWAIDQHGWCLDFDGSDDYVDLGTPESLKPDSQITIAAWIKPDATQSNLSGRIISKSNGSTGENWGLLVDDQLRVQFRVASANRFSQFAMTADEWNFAAGSYDGKQTRVYENGSRATTSTSGSISTGNPVAIGRNPSSTGRYFTGRIAVVFVWDRGLHDGEVLDLYRLGPYAPFSPKPRPAKVGVAAVAADSRDHTIFSGVGRGVARGIG